MSAVPKTQVLGLYRSFLRQASQYTDYNMRSYVRRRVREDFRKYSKVSGAEVESLWQHGKQQFGIVKRQAQISQMYPAEPSVMDHLPKAARK